MESKTFKILCIGDTIYKLCDNYELGKPDKKQISAIVIESLSIDKDTGNLLINKYEGSRYSDSYWSFVIKSDSIDESTYNFNPEQNSHRRGFFFTNIEDANDIVRKAVISKISDIEASIPKIIADKRSEIETLRSTFYEILNPSLHKDFTLI